MWTSAAELVPAVVVGYLYNGSVFIEGEGTMSMNNIEPVVVLMLENRSFDAMLGWLYQQHDPPLNIPPAAQGDKFRGLHGIDLTKFVNTANDGLSSPPVRGTSGFTVPSVGPGEEFDHVNMQ